MYKICKTEESTRRQRIIEEKLFDLMRERRYEDISISELCLACDIPRKAFYRYFDNKDSALTALIDHRLLEYETKTSTRVTKNGQRMLSNELERFFVFWRQNKDFLSVIEKNGLLPVLVSESVKYPINDVISIKKFLPDESDEMRRMIFRFAILGLISIMIDWYHRGFEESAHEISKAAVRVLSRPLFPFPDEIGILTE